MMKLKTFALLLSAVIFLINFHAHSTTVDLQEKPFWRTKPKVLARILDERAIIVSVKTEKIAGGQERLIMNGGGAIKRPAAEVFSDVQKYENLKKVSERIVEVKFDAEKNELFVHCEAFKYHARMWMTVTPTTLNKPGMPPERRLSFKVLRGNFIGMQGAYTFEEYKPGLTLMGYTATFDYKTLPMPRFFVEFGLEVILQKVARDMRTFLEK